MGGRTEDQASRARRNRRERGEGGDTDVDSAEDGRTEERIRAIRSREPEKKGTYFLHGQRLAYPDRPRQEVPDYLIDNISFAIMHDPVVTKTGNSYDRSTLLEHLKRSNTDPLTREPLTTYDLRPNLALKQACAEFLEENGWAVDW